MGYLLVITMTFGTMLFTAGIDHVGGKELLTVEYRKGAISEASGEYVPFVVLDENGVYSAEESKAACDAVGLKEVFALDGSEIRSLDFEVFMGATSACLPVVP